MTDRVLTTSAQVCVTCAQLPGQEIKLARREMRNTSGGLAFVVLAPAVLAYIFADEIAELYKYCIDEVN